ncbi:MAG: tetratricopeptide repeat protein [bacterium]
MRPIKQFHPRKSFIVFLVALLAQVTVALPPAGAGSNGRSDIDRVGIHPPASWRIHSGFRWEYDRRLVKNSSYNNLRVRPLEFTYAFTRNIQFGGQLTYSSNSADKPGSPDKSGIEALNLRTKYQWNRNVAGVLTLGRGISDEVHPYGGEGLKVGMNFPVRLSMGPGSVTGELGFTLNGRDQTVGTSNLEWSNYLNYSVGYYYELTNRWRVSAEILGHDAAIDTRKAKDYMEASLTPEIMLSETSVLKPSVSVGLSAASPAFAVGLNYTYRLGGTQENRVTVSEADIGTPGFGTSDVEPPETTSKQVKKRQREKPLVLPGEDNTDSSSSSSTNPSTTKTDTPQNNPQRAQSLAEKGRTAYQEDGNLDKAISLYREALKYDDENVEILSNLASLLYQKEKYTEARRYYERALEVDPRDQFSHLYLGITLYKLEKYSEAERHLKRARGIDSSNRIGRQAQTWLDRLEQDT